MNPGYIKLAQIAYNTVIQTMLDGEESHGDEWKYKDLNYHKRHAMQHAENAYAGRNKEDEIGHMITRGAMVKYLEQK